MSAPVDNNDYVNQLDGDLVEVSEPWGYAPDVRERIAALPDGVLNIDLSYLNDDNWSDS